MNSGRSVFIGENAGITDNLTDKRNVAIGSSAMQSLFTTTHLGLFIHWRSSYKGIGSFSQ